MTTHIDIPVVLGKDHIRRLPAYIGGKTLSAIATDAGCTEAAIVKMSSNENPLGMSTRAIAAATILASKGSSLYPDPGALDLRTKIAELFDVDTDCITVGNGSSELLKMVAEAFSGPGDSVVMSQYGFAEYHLAAASVNAETITVPAHEMGNDLEAMLEAIRNDSTVMYVANPNNPTGTFSHQDAIRSFLDRVPRHVVVVLDEAYAEYLPDAFQSSPGELIAAYPNLMITRTFSKAYGLAGLRIGYSIAQRHLAQIVNQVRMIFNTNSFAQATALAALDDRDFLVESRAVNESGKVQLYQAFDRLGVAYVPTAGNFVLVNVTHGDIVARRLLTYGIAVRSLDSYGLEEWIRVSICLTDQNQRFIEALSAVLSRGLHAR